MSGRWYLSWLLALAHAVADGMAGWLLGTLPFTLPLSQVAVLIFWYNLLAFASQPLLGMLVDARQGPDTGRWLLLGGLVGAMISLLVRPAQPLLAVTLAGFASACFHVGGGSVALLVSAGRAAAPGVFAAPGAMGLALGGAAAVAQIDLTWLWLGCALLLAVGVFALPFPAALPMPHHTADRAIDTHDLVMFGLLAAIGLRSAVWDVVQWLMLGQIWPLLGLGCAAMIGKCAGGFLADWLGWRRYAMWALGLAAPLLSFADGSLWLLLPGIALLQSVTPIGIAAVAQRLPGRRATAAGLTFGLAVAVGGVPHLLGLNPWLQTAYGIGLLMVMLIGVLGWALIRPAPQRGWEHQA